MTAKQHSWRYLSFYLTDSIFKDRKTRIPVRVCAKCKKQEVYKYEGGMMKLKCPKCQSENIEEFDLESDFDKKLKKHVLCRIMFCPDCECEFVETYVRDASLTEITDTTEPFEDERTH